MSESTTHRRVVEYHLLVVTDEDTFNRALGARIASMRKALPMNQQALADQVGMGRTSIVMIERGRQRVHAHLLLQLAEALGTTGAALLAEPAPGPRVATTAQLPASKESREWLVRSLNKANIDVK